MLYTAETTFTDAELRESKETIDLAPKTRSFSARDEKAAVALADYKPVETTNVHITETPLTLWNWYKYLAWQNVISIFVLPFLGMLGAFWTSLRWETALLSIAYYFVSGSGIMAGYHRLWSHRSFSATFPLKVYLAATGAAAVQGSIRWWAFDHRAHHRNEMLIRAFVLIPGYTDTDKDPYWVSKGFLYAHMGWMILKRDTKRIGRTNVSDLKEDAVVKFQHRYYNLIMVIMAFVVPTLIAGSWHDWRGGFIYAGLLRIFALQQSTFCINSLAHWLGDQPYDDRHSPRNHFFTGIVSLGEGFHNFHHEFPSDYRNSVIWYQYDPMKWCIWAWKQLGLAYDLKEIRSETVEKGKLLLQQKKLDDAKAKLVWGIPTENLPVMSWTEFQERADSPEHALIAIAGIIHDVKPFIDEHPGGRAFISSGIGKDATPLFNGGVYDHSNASRNILAEYRVALLEGGGEVEIWKGSVKDRTEKPKEPVEAPKATAENKINLNYIWMMEAGEPRFDFDEEL